MKNSNTINFDEFGPTPKTRNRLVERHKRIIVQNTPFIEGKRVLDLASNNARWTYAALHGGATSVTGVEGRLSKIDEAHELIERAGLTDRCSFVLSDIYDYLFTVKPCAFDTILCLGIYYHIMDHYLLLRLMAKAKPETIIIDSGFLRSFTQEVFVKSEDPDQPKNALPAFEGQKQEIVGVVSLGLMNQMAWNCGYKCEPVLWASDEVEHKESVSDYLDGCRYTLRLTKMNGFHDADWKELWREPLKRIKPKFEFLLDEKRAYQVMDKRCKKPDVSIRQRLGAVLGAVWPKVRP